MRNVSMIHSSTLGALLIALVLWSGTLASQTLTVTSPNLQPGDDIHAVLTNTLPQPIVFGSIQTVADVHLFTEFGESLFADRSFSFFLQILPGETRAIDIPAFALPFGDLSPGNYVLEVVIADPITSVTRTIATQVRIGTPPFGQPVFMTTYQDGAIPFRNSSRPNVLRVVNTSSQTETFPAATWLLETFGAAPVATQTGTFPAMVVEAGAAVEIPWPGSSLNGSITEELTVLWNDPGLGSFGDFVEAAGPLKFGPMGRPLFAFLLRPNGNVIPGGGHLDVFVQTAGPFPCNGYCLPPVFEAPPNIALAIAAGSGAIALPGGAILPLANDPLLLSSLTGGLSSIVLNSPGLTAPVSNAPWPGRMGRVRILHPGPAFSGAVVFMAGIGYDPAGTHWQTTPAHRLFIG